MPIDNHPPSAPYTFTQIIDADHLTIQSLASKTRHILTTIPTSTSPSPSTTFPTILTALTPLLTEITWRLIRHDLSESLVMRPAFIANLPAPQGREMAEHDARDHAHGRVFLLGILDTLSTLPDPTKPTSETIAALQRISRQVIAAFDELGQHMAVESGRFLPYFETLIDEGMSRRLAGEYMASLCMTPYLTVPETCRSLEDGEESSASEGCASKSKLVFADVDSYVRMEPSELKSLYEKLSRHAATDEGLRQAMMTRSEKEADRLQVWKWRGINANTMKTNSSDEGHRTNKL